jgi:hypothetical protein
MKALADTNKEKSRKEGALLDNLTNLRRWEAQERTALDSEVWAQGGLESIRPL